MDNKLGQRFTKNLVFAISAQGTSFLFSVLMSLFVPMMLGVEQYAYWQLFIFYSTYVGFFHFGLSDGVYLKYGGTELEDLDQSSIGSQLKLMIIWQTIISIVVIPFLLNSASGEERQYVWILVVVYLVVANAAWYLGYVFQAANITSVYSISIIVSKASYIVFIAIMFCIKVSNFKPFVLFYVIAQGIALLYVAYYGRKFIFSKMLPIKETIQVTFSNIKIGINLTISNIVSSLILGIGRVMVDKTDGISTFGLLSLSISLTNFFLQFINQVSLVMFPTLRQIEDEKTRAMFLYMRSGISYIICSIMLFYAPLKYILLIWIPQYKASLYYIIFLLPICVFDGKMQMIYNTYLKVYRKERVLLIINVVSLIISTILCGISAFVLKDIIAVAIAMMVAIIVRSIVANIYLSKLLNVRNDDCLFFEIMLTIIFIVCNVMLSIHLAFLIYFLSYILYLVIKRKNIAKLYYLINIHFMKK